MPTQQFTNNCLAGCPKALAAAGVADLKEADTTETAALDKAAPEAAAPEEVATDAGAPEEAAPDAEAPKEPTK